MAKLRPLLPLLMACLASCAPAPLLQAPAAVMTAAGLSLSVPTARVRIEPADTLDANGPIAEPPALYGRHLAAIASGPATRLRRPAEGNSLFLALSTPELDKPGVDVQLRLDGAAVNEPDAGSKALDEPDLPQGPACALPEIELGAPAAMAPAVGFKALAVGEGASLETTPFWVIRPGLVAPRGKAYSEIEVKTRRVATSAHCEIFLDVGVPDGQTEAGVAALAEAFESRIYPGVTAAFGPPPVPAAGLPPVTIVLTPHVSALGRTAATAYFARRDLQPRDPAVPSREHSNQRPVLFVDAPALAPERRMDLFATVAHEFQHLVNFGAKTRVGASGEVRWLDEALAMYASEACGYGPEVSKGVYQHVAGYLQRPYKYSLTDWPGNPAAQGYGIGYLFMTYLAERFGPALVRDLVDAKLTGKANLDAALVKRGSSYAQAFGDWGVAVANDGLLPAPVGPYAYKRARVRGEMPFGKLKGPSAIRLGPNGARLPRRADVAFFFHLRPGAGTDSLVLRTSGGPFQAMALVP